MQKVPVKLTELVEIWSMGNDESFYYLNTETGQLEYYWPDGDMGDLDIEDLLNNPVWIELPHDDSRTGYRDMAAFVEQLENQAIAQALTRAITGKGAFRRFKDVLMKYPQVRESWFAFQMERIKARVQEWLAEHDLEVD